MHHQKYAEDTEINTNWHLTSPPPLFRMKGIIESQAEEAEEMTIRSFISQILNSHGKIKRILIDIIVISTFTCLFICTSRKPVRK